MADQNKQHYIDDERNFGAINEKLDKREELARIHGEHLSHISKSISELNNTVQDIILPHITAVSPILAEYQEKQENERVIMRAVSWIKRYGLVATFIASVLGAIVYTINFFKFR